MTRGVRDTGGLIAFVDSRHPVPHQWGREANDCVAFVLAAVEVQTGVRPAADLKWNDRASALRVIRRFGSLEAAFDSFFDRIPPAFAQRGDIAGVPAALILGPSAAELALIAVHPMLFEGTTLCFPGERGLQRARRNLATVAWDATSARRTAKALRAGAKPDE